MEDAPCASEMLTRALRRLDKVAKRHATLMPEAIKQVKVQLGEDKENLTSADMEVAAKVLTEYVDALDFMNTMWGRLREMTHTRSWEVHSALLAQMGLLFE